jgi:hypothetical protein
MNSLSWGTLSKALAKSSNMMSVWSPSSMFRVMSSMVISNWDSQDRLTLNPLDRGLVPDDWKKANIVPVFKKGEKHMASNCRPVSLTSIACKLLEHIVHSSIMDHFQGHSVVLRRIPFDAIACHGGPCLKLWRNLAI